MGGAEYNRIIRLCDVLQSMLSFVAGCAWTTAVTMLFPSIGANPYPSTILTNVGVGLLLALLGVAFLILTGKPHPPSSSPSSSPSPSLSQAIIPRWMPTHLPRARR